MQRPLRSGYAAPCGAEGLLRGACGAGSTTTLGTPAEEAFFDPLGPPRGGSACCRGPGPPCGRRGLGRCPLAPQPKHCHTPRPRWAENEGLLGLLPSERGCVGRGQKPLACSVAPETRRRTPWASRTRRRSSRSRSEAKSIQPGGLPLGLLPPLAGGVPFLLTTLLFAHDVAPDKEPANGPPLRRGGPRRAGERIGNDGKKNFHPPSQSWSGRGCQEGVWVRQPVRLHSRLTPPPPPPLKGLR